MSTEDILCQLHLVDVQMSSQDQLFAIQYILYLDYYYYMSCFNCLNSTSEFCMISFVHAVWTMDIQHFKCGFYLLPNHQRVQK